MMDSDAMKWLHANSLALISNHDWESEGTQIWNVIPPVFDEYILVYHPIYLDPTKPDITKEEKDKQDTINHFNNTLSKAAILFEYPKELPLVTDREAFKSQWEHIIQHQYPSFPGTPEKPYENKELDKKISSLMKEHIMGLLTDSGALRDETPPEALKEMSWKKYAKKLGLEFHPEISWGTFIRYYQDHGRPLNVIPPYEDYLPRSYYLQTLQMLINQLGDQEVIIEYGERSTLSELLEDSGWSNLILPLDRKWIIYTPSDLVRTIIAGDAAFIQLFDPFQWETQKVTITTRVDYLGDKVNPTFTGY